METLNTMTRKKKNIGLDTLIELHNEGLYDREIAEMVGCSRHNVTARLNRAGITGRKSKFANIELRNRISNTLIGRYCGEDNPNYKGYADKCAVARGLSKTISHKMIRNNNYTCQMCGHRGGDLETNHIVPFSKIMGDFLQNTYDGNSKTLYSQLTNFRPLMDEKNLIVLCKACHKKVHSKDNHEPSLFEQEGATTIPKGSRVEAIATRNAEGLSNEIVI